MLNLFIEVKEKLAELEELEIKARANAITYQQKGELHTSERLLVLADYLSKAVLLLRDGINKAG